MTDLKLISENISKRLLWPQCEVHSELGESVFGTDICFCHSACYARKNEHNLCYSEIRILFSDLKERINTTFYTFDRR